MFAVFISLAPGGRAPARPDFRHAFWLRMLALVVKAFVHVIVPVVWPGGIPTGLVYVLLAGSDFTVTALLASQGIQTMIPRM